VVLDFYRQNHTQQTLAFVLAKKREYGRLDKTRMGIWEAMEALDRIVDDSDPDTDLTQIEHCLQTAEAIREAGKPDWFIVAGLIHDLGKVLALWGEPQWAVVGDTFPVGCPWSEKIVYHHFFEDNPDRAVPEFQQGLGIYQAGCGLNHVHLSWGHDEYLYRVVRDYLPEEALAMIRFHSFYPWHREGAYTELMDDKDRQMLKWVQEFNPFDLYTKSSTRPDVERLKPYYQDLLRKYFPEKLRW
jgi:inositol oxygenase